jgi:hypothetical protein
MKKKFLDEKVNFLNVKHFLEKFTRKNEWKIDSSFEVQKIWLGQKHC